MADPATYRPKTSDIPLDPGVYRFLDDDGRIIYVGKAKSLRKRLVSYFRDPEKLHPRTRQMVFTASSVVWVIVKSELEALTLEYAWIKEYNPRFNVMYRDDKSYPYLAVTTAEQFPRMMVTRNAHRKGNRYYGPYTQSRAVRDSVDLLLRVFPVRSCTSGVFETARRTGRPCLNGFIDKCVAPCVGRVTRTEYLEIVSGLTNYLDGSGEDLRAEKQAQMERAAAELEFEQAAKLRDQIFALESIAQRNTVVLDRDVDADVFAIEHDELEASVQVFHIRAGRIRGQRGWVSETDGYSLPALVHSLIVQVYGAFSADVAQSAPLAAKVDPKSVDDVKHTALQAIPREIWVPELPEDEADLRAWLSEMRGSPVRFHIPQRGAKRQLMDTVQLNAKQALQRHKLQRSGDLTQRSQALEELRDELGLASAPLRIECFDISHTQGSHQVASMVVFEDGLAKKKDYRHFIVRGPNGAGASDDTAAMDEVLTRRLQRLIDETAQRPSVDQLASGESSLADVPKFAYRPDLLVVDGGLPQVNAAQRVVERLGLDVPVIGLAKRLEEVWIAGDEYPVIFSRTSPALHLLQYLRDESHRFAITFHRQKRAKAMTNSVLDTIPGLGIEKQKALLRKFKSVKQIRELDAGALQTVPGIGPKLAQTIIDHLNDSL